MTAYCAGEAEDESRWGSQSFIEFDEHRVPLHEAWAKFLPSAWACQLSTIGASPAPAPGLLYMYHGSSLLDSKHHHSSGSCR